MNYIENVQQEMIRTNRKSRNQPNHEAWDNKKIKTRELKKPRGKVFDRLEQIERSVFWKQIVKELTQG